MTFYRRPGRQNHIHAHSAPRWR